MTFIEIVQSSWKYMLDGLWITLFLTMSSVIIGFFIAIFLSLSKMYGNKVLYTISNCYIEIIRGTPLLVQLFILYYSLPVIGIRLSPLTASIISFFLNSSAYQAEYLRGAIQSISSGQMQAALSIGMTKWQSIRFVILPQAIRRFIPSWTNEFIYLLKYSSLSYIVGAPEIMAQAKFVASRNFEFFKVYLFAGIIYFLLVTVFSEIFRYIENKLKIPGTLSQARE
ncbi:MAG: amino acid ABC transporter permease [Defluviitoga tunisiensis]|jgi:polar amino acid transport system permease protein|uniref:ABC-type amino acid transport system, permease component n=1 Tax=Defluviitoga tunisiensis TaxID=1006576 RepID=A0A0C7NKY4_DEFTU|nr:amino acid ABC transporter permease [Defluviitoga tunisiensis]MDD3601097.1 amino acid ABC transporter permease [Defluviitoga tunisiensis]MDY0379591.1 amino acid ABC transporter permease [Defluviitoga tunisiensis]CEP78571.1 ABC-type amino acid transport system, permease component [Defluviitoga tunisiensis]HOB55051.1 amino acid ABC transporter permease [Defluviitoga tunisiensis]HOK15732.1 amino acid ABC transporter permease [Defluviitoga tunisiensis]